MLYTKSQLTPPQTVSARRGDTVRCHEGTAVIVLTWFLAVLCTWWSYFALKSRGVVGECRGVCADSSVSAWTYSKTARLEWWHLLRFDTKCASKSDEKAENFVVASGLAATASGYGYCTSKRKKAKQAWARDICAFEDHTRNCMCWETTYDANWSVHTICPVRRSLRYPLAFWKRLPCYYWRRAVEKKTWEYTYIYI